MAYETLDSLLIREGCVIMYPDDKDDQYLKSSPVLNGIWSSALAASDKLKASCGFYSEVYCGSALTTPSEKICDLLGFDANEQLFTSTIVLPKDESGEIKSSIITLRASDKTVRFGVVSINSTTEQIRYISQLITSRSTEKYILAGSLDNDANYETLCRNYKEVLQLIENVEEWKKPMICENCPVALTSTTGQDLSHA